MRTLMTTHPLPVLSRAESARDGTRLRDTLALPLLTTSNLPLPVYEAEIGSPQMSTA